jgi:hypothetical protein
VPETVAQPASLRRSAVDRGLAFLIAVRIVMRLADHAVLTNIGRPCRCGLF